MHRHPRPHFAFHRVEFVLACGRTSRARFAACFVLALALLLGPLGYAATPTASDVVALPAVPGTSRLINLSTRVTVLAGDGVAIAGFVVRGGPKRLLLRAIGPSLSAAGVTGVLADPAMQLVNAAGATVRSNDNWADAQSAEIQATGLAPNNGVESAMIVTLAEGSYTAVVRGVAGATGVALLEAYDLDPAGTGRLANLSTRGSVLTGDRVMIAGFVIGGNGARRVLLRALGPGLAAAGVTGLLSDPQIRLVSSSGEDLRSSDDWSRVGAAEVSVTGLAPFNNAEAAFVATLLPGTYTAIVSGASSGTGVGLVEVYELP